MLKQIEIIWTSEDIKATCPTLTDEEASDILANLERDHDANVGINWDVIHAAIEAYHDAEKLS